MVILRVVPVLNVPQGIWRDLTHSVLLSGVVVPALYLLGVRPSVKIQMKGHNRAERHTVIALGLFAAMVIASVFLQSTSARDQRLSAQAIDLANRQRTLVGHIMGQALLWQAEIGRDVQSDAKRLGVIRETTTTFEDALRALLDGDKRLGVRRCTDSAARESLVAVRSAWDRMLVSLPPRSDLGSDVQIDALESASLATLGVMDSAIASLQRYYETRSQTLTVWQATTTMVTGFVGLLLITSFVQMSQQRRLLQTNLVESDERFRQLAENVDQVFWITSPDHQRMIYVSPAYETIYGRTCKDLYANPMQWIESIHEEDRQRVKKALIEHGEGVFEQEYRIVRPDGTVRWILDRGFPVHNEKGEIHRVAGVAIDRTAQRQTEEELKIAHRELESRVNERTTDLVNANEHLRNQISAREEAQESLRRSQERLEQAHRIARMGCWEWTISSNELYWSDEIYRIFGFAPGEFGATYEAFLATVHPDDREFLGNEVEAALRDDKDYDIDHRIVLPDGEVRHVHEQGEVVRDDRGEPLRMVGAVIDITERKEAECELIASNVNMSQALQREKILSTELEATAKRFEIAKLQAQAANRSKSEFLANMSHEIRTPMTAILGFAENLSEPDQSKAERIECVRTIRRNGEYLLNIINDILDLSKVEAGKMTIERVPCDPCKIIAEVASLARVRAEITGLPFSVEYDGEIPKTIRSDPARLRQILINLIGNAIKFTDSGSVRLVTRFVDDATTPQLQFDVIDTGCGMTPDQVLRLFQPFTQADASTTRRFGGTGLGLTISKRFADMLGGDITVVRSAIGLGTTFRATIETGSLEGVAMHRDPLSATTVIDETNESSCDTAELLNGFHILLVEDGLDNQRLISHILERAGATVTIKENGQLALDAVLAAQREGLVFDTVVMDMQMPVMDGYTATARLRARGFTAPIIALTAHAMASDRAKCMDAGCTDYASKPINRKKLAQIIRHHVDRSAAA